MFERVAGVHTELSALVADLDPDAVPLPEAPGLWAGFDRIEKLAAAAKTLLARRVDASGYWKEHGFRDPAEYLAATSGSSVGSARDALATSERLRDLPDTETALRQGQLSTPQVAAVADAAAANPSAEQHLLDTAKKESLKNLRDECARKKAAADPDPDARHRRLHRERRLRSWTAQDGSWNLSARGTPEHGAVIEAALASYIDARYTATTPERESREAYAFDALVDLARNPGGGTETSKDPTKLALLRIDLEALRRGQVDGDELCELTGLGPIPVRVARELLGESIVKLVITNGTDVAHVTHLGRPPTVAQKIALLWMSPQCTVEGCYRTHTEYDHRADWAATHQTRLDALDRLCDHHHDLKTYQGWGLTEGTGKRPMVPPHDPRHPNNSPPSSNRSGSTTLFDHVA